jgi:cell wall-associated NlpC family hydrolase
MTSPADQTLLSALNSNAADSVNGMTVGMSPRQRLDMAMRLASDQDTTNIPNPGSYSQQRVGVPNPYGRGLQAFEPNTLFFDGYGKAKGDSDASKLEEQQANAKGPTLTNDGQTLGNATGQIGKAIQAAMTLAQRAVPYVWGGTSANGVDCSGLLYYAFNAAGIKMPRYRAVDYGHMGKAVSLEEARPGDIIYYDEPGDTDHVGIYIGNGQMIQAPQSGDHVRVSSIGHPTSIRRLFDDDLFGMTATPTGTAVSYNGRPYSPSYSAPISTPPLAPITGVVHPVIGHGNRPI